MYLRDLKYTIYKMLKHIIVKKVHAYELLFFTAATLVAKCNVQQCVLPPGTLSCFQSFSFHNPPTITTSWRSEQNYGNLLDRGKLREDTRLTVSLLVDSHYHKG